MTDNRFSQILIRLREKAQLTNRKLAELADVPESLISGLQAGTRSVGEYQSRKIAAALGLEGAKLESFVLDAIDTCTEKLLTDAIDYPAALLNWLPRQLKSRGILPNQLTGCSIQSGEENFGMRLFLQDGSIASLEVNLTRR